MQEIKPVSNGRIAGRLHGTGNSFHPFFHSKTPIMTIITIPWTAINLTKCTLQGLHLLMDLVLAEEQYERAAVVRNELLRRNSIV